MAFNPQSIVESLNDRVNEILEKCTSCGACVEVCPTPAIDDLDFIDAKEVANGVLTLLKTGEGPAVSESWAASCCASGFCKSVCQEGINPRFMLAMAKRQLKKKNAPEIRKQQGKDSFKVMSTGVRLISRLQLPPDVMGRLSPSSHPKRDAAPDLIFYTGCNMLKTPHIGLLCLDVLDRLEMSYEVHGGPANCCGILQMWSGDDENSARQGGKTIDRFAKTGASEVLSWCPTCEIQFNENLIPSYAVDHGKPFDMTMFPVFLAKHLDQLKTHLKHPVNKRVALHEYPGSIGVTEAVIELLSAIPGLEVVDLGMQKVGYQLATLTNPDFAKKHLAGFLKKGQEAGITTFAGVYHSDHRELVRHEPSWPFEIVNYMDLIGQSMGIAQDDMFKKLRLMQDADLIIAESREEIEAHNLDMEDVRNVIVQQLLGEAFLDSDPEKHPVM
ncbi:(Fe-S)-binding protein [Terasakiella sp. A23]|uniref:(Fe-S)-binding protein n=1 Tax=Terasakiella sp. FCG-A23 TaxID=3080561 RepID=UPI0029537C13|nr:(Fe-S)-binding protein [Terasakiella sp. A23]MDV7340289.1 (Fe-S)-binding protein [Terasakiella sp. A23]